MYPSGFVSGGPSKTSGLIKPYKVDNTTSATSTLQSYHPIDFTRLNSNLTTPSTIPFSCLNTVIQTYSDCGKPLSPEQVEAAFQAFSKVTGYQPLNIDQTVSSLNHQNHDIVNFTGFYIFIPIMLVLIIGIWLAVIAYWMTWPPALFLTCLVFVILYGFNMLYRTVALNSVDEDDEELKNRLLEAQNNFNHSIAYWPQALYAVSCAISGNGSPGTWICNVPEPVNSTATRDNSRGSNNVKQNSESKVSNSANDLIGSSNTHHLKDKNPTTSSNNNSVFAPFQGCTIM
jgi:hypothetical protein